MAKLTRETLKYMGAVKDTAMPSGDMLRDAASKLNAATMQYLSDVKPLLNQIPGMLDTLKEADLPGLRGTRFDDMTSQLKDTVDAVRGTEGFIGFGLVKCAMALEATPGSGDTNPRGGWSND